MLCPCACMSEVRLCVLVAPHANHINARACWLACVRANICMSVRVCALALVCCYTRSTQYVWYLSPRQIRIYLEYVKVLVVYT